MMPETQTYSHSLKLEETAEGVRISVHFYSNNQEQAIEEAFNTNLKGQNDRFRLEDSLNTGRK